MMEEKQTENPEQLQIREQEKETYAIDVKDVVKIYKLYDKPKDRIREAFGFGKKQTHKLQDRKSVV